MLQGSSYHRLLCGLVQGSIVVILAVFTGCEESPNDEQYGDKVVAHRSAHHSTQAAEGPGRDRSIHDLHIEDRYPAPIITGDTLIDQLAQRADSLHSISDHAGVLALEGSLIRRLTARPDLTSPEQRSLCIIQHQLTYAALRANGSRHAADRLQQLMHLLDKGSRKPDSLAVELRASWAELKDLDGHPGMAAVAFDRAAREMADLGHPIRSGELTLATGYAYLDAGMAAEARERFEVAVHLYRTKDHLDTNHFAHLRLAMIDLKPDSAEMILKQVRGLLPHITDPLVIGYYHNLRGRQLSTQGRAMEALNQLVLAVHSLDTVPSKTIRQGVRLAAYLSNAAYCAKHAGEWERCIQLASKSVVVAERILSTGDPFVERSVRDGLCTTLEGFPLEKGIEERYGSGVDRINRVLAMRLSRKPVDPVLIAKNYRNLAAEYQEYGGAMADSILKYATECLEWPAGGERSSAHQLRAFALAHLGRPDEALGELARGLDHHVVNGVFDWKTLDDAQFQTTVRAVELLDDFARVLEVIESNRYRRDERLLERFSRRECDVIDSLFMVEGVDVARLVDVRRKVYERSILFKWPSKDGIVPQEEMDLILALMDDDRSMLFRRERFLMEQGHQRFDRAHLNTLREARERYLLAGLAETDPRVFQITSRIDSSQQLLSKIPPAGPSPRRPDATYGARIRSNLSAGTGLLEYKLTRDEVLIAFVRSTDVILHRFTRTPEFNQALTNFSGSERTHATINSATSKHLGTLQALIPEEVMDGSLTELIIVPDKELSYLPFEALPISTEIGAADRPIVIDRFSVRYALSAGMIPEAQRMESGAEHTVFAFAPDYQEGGGAAEALRTYSALLDSTQRSNAAPLLHNEEEVDGIRALVGTTVFTGPWAIEEEVKRQLSGGGVLHFAMHAFANQDPMRSGLVINAAQDTSDGMRSMAIEPVNDDGIFHAFELLTHPVLSPLVVLSACETGHGTHQSGEGVRSLARSFMLAGAKSTVSSLWKVNDRATKEIMVKFYEKLAEGMGKADALAEAKRWYRKENPNAPPSHWAAFILIGDNEPVHLKKRSPVRPWMIGGGAIAAVVAALAARRRRRKRMAA